MDYQLIDSCTSTNSFEVKLKDRKIDLGMAGPALRTLGEEAASTTVVLLFKIRGHAVSIYASGRMLIKETDKKTAEGLAKELVSALEKGGAIA